MLEFLHYGTTSPTAREQEDKESGKEANFYFPGLTPFFPKVDAQWKLFCIVHNLKKIHRYGPGFA